jgi:holo-[acyl-carrier protein] synthase
MIVGLGIDLCEVPRIARMIERWGARFTEKIFTPGERAYADARGTAPAHYAARFAAKEALLKALGVPPGLSWHELEVVGGGKAAPRMVLTGEARAAADRLGVVRLHLTLTHSVDVAAAVIVAEGA